MMGTWSLGFICLLTCVLPSVFSKVCFFCEITASTRCPATQMVCGEYEDCFVGEGAALGVSMIQNKGCTRDVDCGKEQSVSYMGVTYSLVTKCCKGDLCNAALPLTAPSILTQLGIIIVLLGLI
nr:sperm acrosome membrane-associated protein 4 [Pogona vitticeps]